MNFCINPSCTSPHNPNDQLFCKNCGSELLLEGRYRVIGILGQGGCGKTYEVSDIDGGVKVLKILTRNEPKYVELFQREAQVLSQLSHPGIPSVEPNAYFTFTPKDATEPMYCLVMEKITGLDLREYIRQRGSPIDQILAVQWLIQLSKILQTVHSHNFLHRDIKPSNIMLQSDGHLTLIDFGTVRSITNVYSFGDEPSQATRIISALYTPIEQIKGKPVPQSDFFALGRTFIYLLTAQDLSELYDSDRDELQWRSIVPKASVKLADFLDQLMAPLVSQRPLNADVVLQKLCEIQKDLLSSSVVLTPHQLGNAPTQLAPHRQGTLPMQFNFAAKVEALPAIPTPISPTPISPAINNPTPVTPTPVPSNLDPGFVKRCQQELAEVIGPIAAIICQRTLAQNPQASEHEFIEKLSKQIQNQQDARDFRKRCQY
jgi:eukaryotic-like serine/threonine-protein kinase